MHQGFSRLMASGLVPMAVAVLMSGTSLLAQQAAPLYQAVPAASPYGVCAHVSRGEHAIAREEFKRMKAAGIEWVRTDFDWANVETKPGEWNFKHLDETVDWAEAAGIKVLPILDYDVKWATPAWKNLDKWTNYVRTVVSRYKDRIGVWEVWNEQNSPGMWRDKESGANYATLLKATYETIKEIDPKLSVMYGGTAGLPWVFIEESYKAGAGPYFDIMNVHPYRYPNAPEQTDFVGDMGKLRALMAKYDLAQKPVWITEIGWPTHGSEAMLKEFFHPLILSGLSKIHPDRSTFSLAVLEDPGFSATAGHAWTKDHKAAILGTELTGESMTLADLGKLDPARHDALLLPLTESIPGGKAFDAIEKYVKNGGVLISLSGLPFYYEITQKPDGSWQKEKATKALTDRLHFAWQAWWTHKNVPQTAHSVKIQPEYADKIKLKGSMHGTRFISDSELKTGDVMMVVAAASEKDFTGACSAIYKFNSDLKGGLIVAAFESVGRGSTEKHQGEVLPRANLMAFHAGIERLFWYEFQAPEGDLTYNEDHFGMVHKDLSPKPAYTAMSVLSKARPAGSERIAGELKTGNVYQVGWKRPDGANAWALWTADEPAQITLKITGNVQDAYRHLGEAEKLNVHNGTLETTVTSSVLYLIGPSNVSVTSSK